MKRNPYLALLIISHFYLLWSCDFLYGSDLDNNHKVVSLENVIPDLRNRIEAIKRRQLNFEREINDFAEKLEGLGKNYKKEPSFKSNDLAIASLALSEIKKEVLQTPSPTKSAHEPYESQIMQPNDKFSSPAQKTTNQNDEDKVLSSIVSSEQRERRNSLGFYIGACFPHRANLNRKPMDQAKEEFTSGYQFELEYRRSFTHFFVGFSAGGKLYENRKIYNAPADYFFEGFSGTEFTMEIPTFGKNRTLYAALNVGGKYNFSEEFFIDGRLSAGYANSQHKVTGIDISLLKSSEDHLYWGIMTGLGWQINETASLMLYYILDGHDKSDIYGSQFYSNTGLRLGFDF